MAEPYRKPSLYLQVLEWWRPFPDHAYPRPLPWLGTAVILLVAAGAFGWWFERFLTLNRALFGENGPLETAQVIVLAIAALIFAARGWRSRDPVATLCGLVVFLLIVAMIRETPRCNSSFYHGGMCLPQPGKDGIGLVASLLLLALFYVDRRNLLEALKPRWTALFWPLWIAVLLLAISELGETLNVNGVEESLELATYFYTMCFAIWIYRKT